MGTASGQQQSGIAPTPPVIRLGNLIGRGLRACGVRVDELSEEGIVRAARRQTGLDDLGNPRFRTPLRALVESYDQDPELTFVGRLVARRMLVRRVATRMQIHRDLQHHPEILRGEIHRPLFVIGLPRSGTTLLYNLLAQDAQSRPLLFWEAVSPSPLSPPRTGRSDPRIKVAERMASQLNRLLPELRAIHDMNPRGPEECLPLLLNTFTTAFFRGRLPRYREWLFSVGEDEVGAAYREYRQQLLLLQWQRAGGHWLLKCPSHLFGLGSLLSVFPDACVVQTHRDPAVAVPSLCSLSAALDRLTYRTVDRREVGERTIGIVQQFVDRSMKARESDHGRVLDVHYEELVGDPLAVVRRIYDRFGYPPDPDLPAKIERYLTANPPQKHGPHQYRLADFGLDRRDLGQRFAAYCDRFGIRPSPEEVLPA